MSPSPRPTSEPIFGMINPAEDLQSGARQVERWTKRQAHTTVVFENSSPFVNANTFHELGNL